MADISANLIEIRNESNSDYTTFSLAKYDVQYAKLWKESDRNMNGDIRASLIGIFPKLICETAPIPKSTVQSLTALLNQAYFYVKFLDPQTNTVKTARYYAGDFDVILLKRQQDGWYDKVAFNLVPVSKRS